MDSMYAYIKGELAEKNIDSIVVEAAGVGYLIYIPTQYFDMRSEERRVGKECRSRWSPYH